MPAITLSDGFITGNSGLMARLMSLNATDGDNNFLGLLSGGGANDNNQTRNGIISIMKGTVPTDFSTLIDYTSRSADVLVQWAVTTAASRYPSATFSTSSITNTNPANINTTFVSAVASGTATWFWWITRGNGYFGASNQIFDQIIGTVGLPGTGNDLEIPSTSVTTGQLFRLIDLRMQISTSYSY